MERPMMAGSAPKRLRQMRSLRITLRSALGQFVSGGEFAAHGSADAEHAEISRRDGERREPHWTAGTGELPIVTGDAGDGAEGAVARPDVAQVKRVQRELGEGAAIEEDAHNTVGAGIGQRAEQNAVDDAEDGAIGADGER